jgi:flagellin
MSGVTLSSAVRSNLLSLQNTASLLDTTQTRLATGNKVNDALDNPTSYFTAASLNSRASDLGNLLDSVSNAVQTIQAANDGITSISKLVQSAQATASQAQQLSPTVPTGTAKVTAGSFTTLDVASAGSGSSTTAKIDFSAYSNLDLSSGSISFDISLDGFTQIVPIVIDATAVSDWNTFSSGPTINASNVSLSDFTNLLNFTEAADYGPQTFSSGSGHVSFSAFAAGSAHSISVLNLVETGVTGTTGLANHSVVAGTDAAPAASVSFNVNVDGSGNTAVAISAAAVATYNGTHTAISASALSAQDVANLINSQLGSSIAAISGGALQFTSTSAGASSSVAISGFTTAGTVGGSTGIANASNTGSSTTGPNPARAALVSQYNGLLSQIDLLAADAGYNGNNLLTSSSSQLKVVFNETGTSSLTITGKNATSSGLGLAQPASTDFDSNSSITAILGKLKAAQDTLSSDASSFGSNLSIVQTRQDFTKALINTLQTGASNLTLADGNEEAADRLALQTRQSLSTKALSLASQSDQNVLRLLQ